MIHFTVPGQPQGKARPRVGKVNGHARMFTPSKTVAYESAVAHAAWIAMDGAALIDGPCRVVLRLACQVPASWSKRKSDRALCGQIMPATKPDIDNTVKAIFDACNGVVWKDDSQVVMLACSKRYGESPGVTVEIEPLAQSDPKP